MFHDEASRASSRFSHRSKPLMTTTRFVRTIPFALLAPALFAPLSSAAPPSAGTASGPERPRWTELTLPADFAGASTVHALGTNVVFQTPTNVYLWSAITTRWIAVPASPSAQVTQFNAYVTIEDGATVHAFATRTGVVETLHLASVPQVFHGQVSSCWISIAVAGTDAWSFGAFDGAWHHRALASATPTVTISQTAGVLSDGVGIYGVSAYDGELVPGPSLAGATLSAGGDLAIAANATTVAGFSAHTNQWKSAALSNAIPLAVERGYAMFWAGPELVAFSACTGTFASHPVVPGFAFLPGRYVAGVQTGNTVLAYSSGRNVFDSRTFAAPPVLTVDDEVLAASDGTSASAFSVVTGTFSAAATGAFTVRTNDAMAWIDDGVRGLAYCPIRGGWVEAPVMLASGTQVSVLRNVVVLSDAQGHHAFSGRTGDWVFQPVSSAATFTASTSGDVFVAFDGARTLVFDPVIVRWAAVDSASPVQTHDVWRQTFVGFDGRSALGFGLMNNAWSSMPVRGAFQSLDANSSCGVVVTSSHVYAYSAHGSLSTSSRFPEFSRLQPIGAPLRLVQAAPPGSRVVAVLGLEAGYRPLPPLGTLFVEPSSVFRRVPLGTVPASGVLDVALDLSSMSGLAGRALHVQTFVTPPSGGRAWIANAIAPILL